jgi:hypothetical protein
MNWNDVQVTSFRENSPPIICSRALGPPISEAGRQQNQSVSIFHCSAEVADIDQLCHVLSTPDRRLSSPIMPFAKNATSVLFLALSFFMMARTCTLTVLSRIFNS